MMQNRLEYQRAWVAKNKEKVHSYQVAYRERHRAETRIKHNIYYAAHKKEITQKYRELRREVLDYYGGKCTCCGETTFEFLAIDHVNGNGAEHRRETKLREICRWLRDNNYPDGFQVLCHNCNLAKGFYGKCPHKKGDESTKDNQTELPKNQT